MTTLEHVPCDLCGAIDAAPYRTVRDYIYGKPGEFTLVKCGYCGLIYLNPRPNAASIGAYYPDLDYHAFKPASGLKGKLLDRMRKNEARSLMEILPTNLPTAPHVLEIGCATGDLLVELRSLRAVVTGIEPNDAAANVGRQRSLTIHTGILDNVQLEENQFDLVIMKYALEHVHSPTKTMLAIKKLLKPGGKAVFWVPNDRSWDARLFGKYWRGYDSPRHLYIFTPDTMRRVIVNVGMKAEVVAYSPVPNDWAGSGEFWLQDHKVPGAKWLGIHNPLIMVLWLPVSILAAIFHRAGRIRVTASKVR